jgi:hypothetical protein
MRASIGYGNNGDKIDDFQRDGRLTKMIVSDEKFMIGIECTLGDLVDYDKCRFYSIGKYTIEDFDDMYEHLDLVFCPVIIDA